MDQDTDIGGPNNRFPVTNRSAISAVRSEDRQVRQRAFEAILASYWKPSYKYVRMKWQATNEDAKDLTQGFFVEALEKNYFANYDAGKAGFQTFLRTCLDGFVANQRKAARRLKRGGGIDHFSLDFTGVEEEISLQSQVSNISAEEYFHREWVRSLFTLAVETLRQRFNETERSIHFKLFELYDLEDEEPDNKTSYASLAERFGLNTATVNNYLAAARREFRKILLEKLREITATEEEFLRESHALLGVKKL